MRIMIDIQLKYGFPRSDKVTLKGGAVDVVLGVTMPLCAKEILDPIGTFIIELFIVRVRFSIGAPDQFSSTIVIPFSDSNKQVSTMVSWILPS